MATRNRQISTSDEDGDINTDDIQVVADPQIDTEGEGEPRHKRKKKTSELTETVKEFSSIIGTLVQSMKDQNDLHASEMQAAAKNQAALVDQ